MGNSSELPIFSITLNTCPILSTNARIKHNINHRAAIRLALRADEIGHWLYIPCITGESQTPKFPAALDRCEHRVVVIGHAGGARGVIRVRDGQRHHVTAAIIRRRIAATTGIAEARRTSTGEVALVPGDGNCLERRSRNEG